MHHKNQPALVSSHFVEKWRATGKKNYQNILKNGKKKLCTSSLSRKCPFFIVLHNPGSTMHLMVEIVIMGGIRKLEIHGDHFHPVSDIF